MVLGIQVIGVLFGILMLYSTYIHFRRKEFTAKAFGVWVGLWVVFIALALFPQMLDRIVAELGFIRTLDFFIVLGFMFLIGAVFLNYSLLRKQQKKLEELVRKVALEKRR